ncbi:MAG: hypothetical protein HDS68_02545 [Bacteroidales bacterium]|nr:hypothetical protein [Bacteroidales bacterium]
MAKKAKVKVKSKPKNQSNRQLIGKTKVRTTTHLLINADGNQRRKGW